MPRPNKPSWHPAGRCFRCMIDRKPVYFPQTIGRFDKPLIDGVPKAAWDWLEEYKAEQRRNVIDVADPTVFVLCQLYLQWVEGERDAGRMSDSNYEGHTTRLTRFWECVPDGVGGDKRRFGDRRASELDFEDLTAFVNTMQAVPYSPHYIANICSSVQASLNWATKPVKGRNPVRYLTHNPVQGFRPPKPPKASERYIEPVQLRAFLRWAWRRARHAYGVRQKVSDLVFVRLLWFLALTGARPGEACGARWDQINWRNQILVLEEWKNRKKTGELREIHITPPVARLLRAIERIPGRNPEWVFTHKIGRGQGGVTASSEGTPWNGDALGYKIRKWRKVAKKEWETAKAEGKDVGELPIVVEGAGRFVAYLLRHTYISEGLHAGLSESEIAELCGTSAEMIRDTYGHIQRKHSAKRAQELAAKLRAH